LERNKFEYTLIQKALETPSQDLRVKNLKFLVDIGVIQSLNGEKLKDIAKNEPQNLPAYNTVSGLTPEVTKGVISENVRELDRQILFILQRDYPNSLVTFSDNPNVELNNSTLPLVQPAAKLALEKAIKNRGKRLTVNAAYRSPIAQHIIYSYYKQGIGGIAVAATPGNSNHETGLAIDIEDAEGWKSYLEAEGWSWMGKSDPVHFSFTGSENLDIAALSIKSFQQLWNLNHPQDKLPENGLYDSKTASRISQAPPNGFPNDKKCSTKCGLKSP
jgi:LAS superfamily LD-carboxypeptidase LdcB